MTIYFKNHQITIYRKRRRTGTDRYSLSATFTGYSADIQPLDPQRTELVGGRIGATYTGFVDANVQIKENDQVVTEDGKRYSVKGVSVWQGAGLLDHIELLLMSQDGDDG